MKRKSAHKKKNPQTVYKGVSKKGKTVYKVGKVDLPFDTEIMAKKASFAEGKKKISSMKGPQALKDKMIKKITLANNKYDDKIRSLKSRFSKELTGNIGKGLNATDMPPSKVNAARAKIAKAAAKEAKDGAKIVAKLVAVAADLTKKAKPSKKKAKKKATGKKKAAKKSTGKKKVAKKSTGKKKASGKRKSGAAKKRSVKRRNNPFIASNPHALDAIEILDNPKKGKKSKKKAKKSSGKKKAKKSSGKKAKKSSGKKKAKKSSGKRKAKKASGKKSSVKASAVKAAKKSHKKSHKKARKSKKPSYKAAMAVKPKRHKKKKNPSHKKKYSLKTNPVGAVMSKIKEVFVKGINHDLAEVGGLAAGVASIKTIEFLRKKYAPNFFDKLNGLPFIGTYLSANIDIILPVITGMIINNVTEKGSKGQAVGTGIIGASVVAFSANIVNHAYKMVDPSIQMGGIIAVPSMNGIIAVPSMNGFGAMKMTEDFGAAPASISSSDFGAQRGVGLDGGYLQSADFDSSAPNVYPARQPDSLSGYDKEDSEYNDGF